MNDTLDKWRRIEVEKTSFRSEVMEGEEPVMVVFWAPWSQPCQLFGMVLDEVISATAGSAKVVAVNTDSHPEVSLWFGVQRIPTLLYFVGGVVQATLIGVASKETILAKLQLASRKGNPAPQVSTSSAKQINQPSRKKNNAA